MFNDLSLDGSNGDKIFKIRRWKIDITKWFKYAFNLSLEVRYFEFLKNYKDYDNWLEENGFTPTYQYQDMIKDNKIKDILLPTSDVLKKFYGKEFLWDTDTSFAFVARGVKENKNCYYIIIKFWNHLGFRKRLYIANIGGSVYAKQEEKK